VLNEPYAGYTDAYTMLNATVGVKFAQGKGQFSLRGINLLNQEILQHIYGDLMRISVMAELRFFASRPAARSEAPAPLAARGPHFVWAGRRGGRMARRGARARPGSPGRGEPPPVAVIDVGSNSGRVMVYRQEVGGHLHVLAGSRASLRLSAGPGRDGPHPGRGPRPRLRGSPGFPVDRPGFRRALSSPPGRRRCATPRTGRPSSSASGGARDHDAAPCPASRRPATASWARSGTARRRRGALRPGGGSPAGGALPGRRLLGAVSVPLGALRVSDAFLGSDPPAPREIRRLREHARRCSRGPGSGALGREELVGTGGTLRNLARIDQRASGTRSPRLHGYELTRRRLHEIVGRAVR